MKPGDVLALKTTGELVTIIGIPTDDESRCVIRRPKMTQSGIEHLLENIFQLELETPSEHIDREVGEQLLKMKAQQVIFKAEHANDGPDVPEIKLDWKQ